MKKIHLSWWMCALSIIIVFIVVELAIMYVRGGNVAIDVLIFNDFEYMSPRIQDETLKENQCYFGEDSVLSIIQDSVDYQIIIDDSIIIKDTLLYKSAYSYYCENYWIKPGKHNITIISNTLKTSCSYSFNCLVFSTILLESCSEAPFFFITRTFLPFQRKIM